MEWEVVEVEFVRLGLIFVAERCQSNASAEEVVLRCAQHPELVFSTFLLPEETASYNGSDPAVDSALTTEQAMVRELLEGLPHAVLLESRDRVDDINPRSHVAAGDEDKQLVVLIPAVAWATRELGVGDGEDGKLKLIRSTAGMGSIYGEQGGESGCQQDPVGADSGKRSKRDQQQEEWSSTSEGITMEAREDEEDVTTLKHYLFPVHPSRRFLLPCSNPSNANPGNATTTMAEARRGKKNDRSSENHKKSTNRGGSCSVGAKGVGGSGDGVAGAMLLLLFRWLARQHTRVLALAAAVASDTGGPLRGEERRLWRCINSKELLFGDNSPEGSACRLKLSIVAGTCWHGEPATTTMPTTWRIAPQLHRYLAKRRYLPVDCRLSPGEERALLIRALKLPRLYMQPQTHEDLPDTEQTYDIHNVGGDVEDEEDYTYNSSRAPLIQRHQLLLVNHLRLLDSSLPANNGNSDAKHSTGAVAGRSSTTRVPLICPMPPRLPHIYGPTSKGGVILNSSSLSGAPSTDDVVPPSVGDPLSTSGPMATHNPGTARENAGFLSDCQSFGQPLHQHNTARSLSYTRPLEAEPISLGAVAVPLDSITTPGSSAAATNLANVQAAMAKMPVPENLVERQIQQQQQQFLLMQAQQQLMVEAQLQAKQRVVYSMGGLLALRAVNR